MNAKVRKGLWIAAIVLTLTGAICALVHDVTKDDPEVAPIEVEAVEDTTVLAPADSTITLEQAVDSLSKE